MRLNTSALLVAAGIASVSFATSSFAAFTEITLGAPTLRATAPINKPELLNAQLAGAEVDVDSVYSNTDTFTGSAFANGGATAGITRMVMDDITTDDGTFDPAAGNQIYRMEFSISNLNTVAVAARPRLRFWFDNGGVPGTYLNSGVDINGNEILSVGYTFNPINFGANSANVFFTDFQVPNGYGWGVPQGSTFWAGMTFDNAGTAPAGSTLATNAQLNNLGMLIFDPADVGFSDDTLAFQTTSPGSFFNVSNPAGAPFNFTTGPANFGFSFQAFPVPEPMTLGAIAAGALVAVRRRRA